GSGRLRGARSQRGEAQPPPRAGGPRRGLRAPEPGARADVGALAPRILLARVDVDRPWPAARAPRLGRARRATSPPLAQARRDEGAGDPRGDVHGVRDLLRPRLGGHEPRLLLAL